MDFKNTNEISKILERIDSLPKVACSRCGKIYRGEKKNFTCKYPAKINHQKIV
jgi:hypothetical protein